METVIAKFKCEKSEPNIGDQTDVTFSAVTDGCEENKSFSRWTPAGNLTMCISNETPASKFFQPGEEYYLTFSKTKEV